MNIYISQTYKNEKLGHTSDISELNASLVCRQGKYLYSFELPIAPQSQFYQYSCFSSI